MTDATSMKVVVLGMHIGTAAGGGQVGDEQLFFYDFEPVENFPMRVAKGNGIQFDYYNGTFQEIDDHGNIIDEAGVVVTLIDMVNR